ncbi:MAG: hypothetical protein F4Z51_02880 [Chloroflexi bacterium]|nr:hypothetical protein [Chloroflexota bacterium]MYF80251.1 hypothetical protein [Chloroflexota bacterium]
MIELCRPMTGAWLMLSAALMVVAASLGRLALELPFQYAGMVAAFAYAAGITNSIFDAQIDSRSRLWRPLPAGLITVRGSLPPLVFCIALGSTLGFLLDWQVGVTGLAMLAAAALHSYAWRGSVLGVAPFALVGVLLPIGAIQAVDTPFPNEHLYWVVPVGALAGAATFLIYKLPQFEMDDEDGARSILHWLGIDMAVPTAWAVVTAALALAAASINISGGDLVWLLGPLLYFILIGLFCIWMMMRGITEGRLLIQRMLVVPMLPVLIICWLAAAAS